MNILRALVAGMFGLPQPVVAEPRRIDTINLAIRTNKRRAAEKARRQKRR